jgi:hypothetical protein
MRRLAASAFFGALLLAGAAHAQWTVINLHPPAVAESSGATAGSGSAQSGVVWFGGIQHASAWNGTSASWVDLHPAGAFFSEALGASGTFQVGRADIGGAQRASLWNGTAGSWIDLHPASVVSVASNSVAYGAGGGQQVGIVGAFFSATSFQFHASLWNGSAASWTDLNPAGSTHSEAYASNGSEQAGMVSVAGVAHASLWSGTAASWVDLHPSAATLHSVARGVDGGVQAGYVFVGDASNRTTHASLWRGSAASWVDLNPAGSPRSAAWAAGAGLQAGYAYVSDGSTLHATVWSGTADSALDLHQFLPPEFSSSNAVGVSTDGAYIYVVGGGFNEATGRGEALVWKKAVQNVRQQIELAVTRVNHPRPVAPVQVKYVVRNTSLTQTVSNVRLLSATLAGVAANQALPVSFGDLLPGASSIEATLTFPTVQAGTHTLIVALRSDEGSLPAQTLEVTVP